MLLQSINNLYMCKIVVQNCDSHSRKLKIKTLNLELMNKRGSTMSHKEDISLEDVLLKAKGLQEKTF